MTPVLVGLLALLVVVSLAAGSVIVSTLRLGIPPMPSVPAVRRQILLIVSQFTHHCQMVELGSGWGGLSRAAALLHSQLQVTGIERSLVPWVYSRVVGWITRSRARFDRGDLRTIKLDPGCLYIAYLSRELMYELRAKLERERPSGAILISAAFSMPGWTASRTVSCTDTLRTPIYVYEL